jgi:DNA-binding NtrC family response regulator
MPPERFPDAPLPPGQGGESTAFLQAFVAELVNVMGQAGCEQCSGRFEYIERVGLLASGCLEETARHRLDYEGTITPDQYSDIIVELKNRIGGHFSRASSGPGMVRVVNSRCPFGARVKDAPDLCRMTSSVFGAIAARNFGYAKVELRKRIALNDEGCEVCVYIDPELAREHEGTEYFAEEERLVSRSASTAVTARLEERVRRKWCSAEPEASGRAAPQIVAESAAMRRALQAVEVVAPTMATVLLTGETGSGKELMARAVHALSPRWRKPLVSVNCGAIPENLIETALFGHEKGAFTGAFDVHHGYFERAEKGTLFLDEIDSLPLSAQAKLLRVLQEGEYERVGGKRTMQADVRIVAASNRDIGAMVEAGELRRDLYYRLNVVPIDIPPLRERRDDLFPLIRHILGRLATRYQAPMKSLAETARAKAMQYDWPGNIRELENVFERAFIFSPGAVIEDIDVAAVCNTAAEGPAWRLHKQRAAKEAEAGALIAALERAEGDVCIVADRMGITPRAVRMKLKAHGLSARDFRLRGAR